MGFLAMKDMGAVGIKTESGIFEADVLSTHGALNPSATTYPENKQCINLQAFSLSFEGGKDIDDSSNIAGNVTRLGIGGATSTPITLSAIFSRNIVSESSSSTGGTQYTSENVNAVSYLYSWSRRRTIVMLMWLPNKNTLADNTSLTYGQEKDFFTSRLRTLYDTLWDRNLSNATTGWHDSTYGTLHYKFSSFFDDTSDYEPCAIPIVIGNVSVKGEGGSKNIQVTVTGFVLNNEEEESN